MLRIVLDEIRQRLRPLDTAFVLIQPRIEALGDVDHSINAPPVSRLASEDALRVGGHLLGCLEDGRCVASAVGVPAREFKVLRVLADEVVAHATEGLAVEGVVARQMHLDTNDEVQRLLAFVVGRSVGDIRLRCGEAQGVLIARSVHALPRVIGFGACR